MVVSFDGARIELTNRLNSLFDTINDKKIDKEQMQKDFNSIAEMVDFFNAMYDDGIEHDCDCLDIYTKKFKESKE